MYDKIWVNRDPDIGFYCVQDVVPGVKHALRFGFGHPGGNPKSNCYDTVMCETPACSSGGFGVQVGGIMARNQILLKGLADYLNAGGNSLEAKNLILEALRSLEKEWGDAFEVNYQDADHQGEISTEYVYYESGLTHEGERVHEFICCTGETDPEGNAVPEEPLRYVRWVHNSFIDTNVTEDEIAEEQFEYVMEEAFENADN